MRISLENNSELLENFSLSMEGAVALQKTEVGEGPFLYILLTDTGTTFSKISKAITGDPYNHVSIMLERDFDEVFTFALKTALNGATGGFKKETRSVLKGARYTLYRVAVSPEAHDRVKRKIITMAADARQTAYNHWALFNTILNKPLFETEGEQIMICSQFVGAMLVEAGVDLFKEKHLSTIKPYDFVRTKLLKFVERGTIR